MRGRLVRSRGGSDEWGGEAPGDTDEEEADDVAEDGWSGSVWWGGGHWV